MPGLPRLNIEQQYAALEIKTTSAQMHITTPRPTFKITQKRPEMTIERESPAFEVDWKQVRSESGLKTPIEVTISARNQGQSAVMTAISQSNADGEFLGNVSQKGDRVAQLAKQRTHNRASKDIELGLMPKSIPELAWEPGFVRVNWSRHQFSLEWEGEYMPELMIDPRYSVEIYLRNKPYIRIMVEDAPLPSEAGQIVDTRL